MQVTVEGSNLGTSQEAIYDKIKIGGIPCNLTEYNVSVSEPGSSAGSEQSGGTRLCISGSKLNVDSNLTVYLDNLTCTVDKFPPVNAKAYRQLPSSDRQKSLGKDNRIAGESHTGLGTS
ncbi:hypothetical protein MRX96_021659 [Rhipicephalus microplus]